MISILWLSSTRTSRFGKLLYQNTLTTKVFSKIWSLSEDPMQFRNSINNSGGNIRFHIEGFKKHLSKLGLKIEMQ